jgi:TolB-like protein/Tfp pilus assembly protein PilF
MGLSLKLFGGFTVRDGSGTTLSLRTRKMRALLAYLAVNADKPQPRERLMTLLWGDRDERQARPSLNNALMSIRQLANDQGPALLDSDGEQVTLHGEALESDVARFRALLAKNPAEAAKLYDGLFLDGLSIPDPAFEDWLTATRSELHTTACDALQRAANAAAEKGDTHQAIDAVRRLVAFDPLREDAHRLLIRLLYDSGDRVAALRQYQACADILKKELQVEPDAVTKTLFEEIRRNESPLEASQTPSPGPDAPSTETHASPLDKPSIAVLPFDNLGAESTAELFAEGLTEDVITALAKIPDLFVISSHSTRVYRGKAASAQDVGKALGVRYVLEGSIRTHGDKLRCSVQLVDTARGHHLWAERYDRLIGDIFALQDEIVRHVLIELQVRLTEGDGARSESRGTHNLEAWLHRVQGVAEIRRITREGSIRARDLFAAAHRADPNWSRPLAGIASCYFFEARNGWSTSREGSIAAGIEHAERAIAMDPEDPLGYIVLRVLNVLLGNHDKALALIEKAVSLAPGDHMAVCNLGNQLIWMEKADKAVATFERGMRLAPIVPRFFQRYYGLALQIIGHTDRAVVVLEKLARHEPEYLEGLGQLAAAYVSAGQVDAAQATIKKILEQDPAYTASDYLAAVFFQNAERTEWLRKLLIKAGLPE